MRLKYNRLKREDITFRRHILLSGSCSEKGPTDPFRPPAAALDHSDSSTPSCKSTDDLYRIVYRYSQHTRRRPTTVSLQPQTIFLAGHLRQSLENARAQTGTNERLKVSVLRLYHSVRGINKERSLKEPGMHRWCPAPINSPVTKSPHYVSFTDTQKIKVRTPSPH